MPQALSTGFHLPLGPADAVAHLTSEPWLQSLVGTGSIDVERRDDAVITRCTRAIEVDVPSMARAFVTSPVTVQETRIWSPADGSAVVDIVFVGLPVHATGMLRTQAVDGGSNVAVELEIEARIPMFADLAEQLVAAEMQRVITSEGELAREQLQG